MRRIRILAAVLLVSLLCQGFPLGAAEAADNSWRRAEGDGSYVTIRVPAPSGLQLTDTFYLSV